MRFVKNFPKFQEHLSFMATSTLPQNLQEAAVTICSENFGCPSQERLPKFKEHLFLMTVFKVYHMCWEHGKGSSKLGKVERASVNEWKCMGGLPKKRKKVDTRESLEKGKYLPNSYNAATVNVNYKLSSFFQCYFKSGTEILMTVWKFFFQESFLERGFHISMNERSHFQWGIHL